ncbi:MAG: hypothetical protein DKM50_08310 [Candidatus Margulisiibacteriota bacterium]|nr:MAG: hypothetical protein A2X43_03090 [Candidatus Margulisbacteria bacterium GWD2_39_127]PZM79598.1 MAG: hypothetical protein DKM50_08310 [Candidatus Margulisiibacteriota bacterium]HAR63220.1 hypothetical protein [Candidatus Margulisiibacteriota bacterium]HCY37296.1 hypothetical protein [Candidatus Margulisiibacteriota bacterium]
MKFKKRDSILYNGYIRPELKSITLDNHPAEIWERVRTTLESREQSKNYFQYIQELFSFRTKKGFALAASLALVVFALFTGTKELIMYKETNLYINDLMQSTYTDEPLVEDVKLPGTF